jgi:hypothetical protein
MKLKHGQRVIAYQASDYSVYKHSEQYIHPEITVQFASVQDETEVFKAYGYESSLSRCKLLREETKGTIHFDLNSGCSYSGTVTFRWQTDRRYDNGQGYYGPLYACKIAHCGFEAETIALALKIAKLATHGWSSQPLGIVEALKTLKAIPVVYNRPSDCFILGEHLADNMFGLPAAQRQPADTEELSVA